MIDIYPTNIKFENFPLIFLRACARIIIFVPNNNKNTT